MMFCVLNSRRFPVPRTHYLHVRKLAAGFIQLGYHFKEINDPQELVHQGPEDIVYISNHYGTELTHRLFNAALTAQLTKLLERTQCRLLLWNFHTSPAWADERVGGKRVLHLGEWMYSEAIQAEPVLATFRATHRVHALHYGAPGLPEAGMPERAASLPWDFNFIGAGYQLELTEHCRTHYRSLIRNTPPVVPEGLRWNSFRDSVVNLVFHAPANIRKGIIVERFAEALSLGGLIFHDHPRIADLHGEHPGLRLVRSAADIDLAFAELQALDLDAQLALRKRNHAIWRDAALSYRDQARAICQAFNGGTQT